MARAQKRDSGRVRSFSLVAGFGVVALGLSGCGGVKSSLGLEKKSPDEFTVMTEAPLVMPPDYSLRPPQPGAPRPGNLSPQAQAQQAIIGASPDIEPGSAEAIIVQQSGGNEADPAIRQSLNASDDKKQAATGFLTDAILNLRGENPAEADAIDAQAEADRLREEAVSDKVVGPPGSTTSGQDDSAQ